VIIVEKVRSLISGPGPTCQLPAVTVEDPFAG
jgi:hypothetical protein